MDGLLRPPTIPQKSFTPSGRLTRGAPPASSTGAPPKTNSDETPKRSAVRHGVLVVLVGALVVGGGAAAERARLPLEVRAAAAADGELGDAAAMGLEFDPAATAQRNLQGYMGFRRLQMATTDADAAMGLDFDAAATAKRNLQGYMGF